MRNRTSARSPESRHWRILGLAVTSTALLVALLLYSDQREADAPSSSHGVQRIGYGIQGHALRAGELNQGALARESSIRFIGTATAISDRYDIHVVDDQAITAHDVTFKVDEWYSESGQASSYEVAVVEEMDRIKVGGQYFVAAANGPYFDLKEAWRPIWIAEQHDDGRWQDDESLLTLNNDQLDALR